MTRSTKLRPPRGTIISTWPRPRSIAPTKALSLVGAAWIASFGKPTFEIPTRSAFTIAVDEFELSDPPRRIAQFPDLSARPPASAVTFGRLS